ncbi:uncharacterized protein [Pempheris klunzingeri]|uniref:uncharacterized protein n=1 Tax=Pempheris klunzingeri TaxID=3127111 RepID=UPI00397FAEC2
MGIAQSCIVTSLTVSSVYLLYVHIYSSHKLSKTRVLSSERLPSFLYLSIKYLLRALTRRTGRLYAATTQGCEAVHTVLNCRLEALALRRFCGAAGYGWDYPDTEGRDIPLCFPESLCGRLLLMVLTDDNFRLSPAGLVRVRQNLKTLQPVDELKKGPFMLQVQVQGHRRMNAGVEVDICLSATSRTRCPVWESVLTLLSKNKDVRRLPTNRDEREQCCGQSDEPVPENVKQVEMRVPRTASLQDVWSLSPCRLLSLPAKLFGCGWPISQSLWMLSVCLAEIEKHRGVGDITAPVNIMAQFEEPLLVPGRVMIRFWETTKTEGQSSAQCLSFHRQQHGSNTPHMMGWISRRPDGGEIRFASCASDQRNAKPGRPTSAM